MADAKPTDRADATISFLFPYSPAREMSLLASHAWAEDVSDAFETANKLSAARSPMEVGSILMSSAMASSAKAVKRTREANGILRDFAAAPGGVTSA